MIVTLQTQRVQTLAQVRRVAEGNEPVDFALAERASAYEFIRRTVVQFDYAALGKADKGAVKAYLAKMTGLSRAQLTRLMAQHRSTGRIRDRRSAAGRPPGRCCAASTKSSPMSASRAWRGCRTGTCTTCAPRAPTAAGAVCSPRPEPGSWPSASGGKPRPDGQPGFLRVDTVHQGDRDGAKGVYYVNTVDEVTRYEHIGCVAAISERFLVPVLETLLSAYPFAIQGFHADNGSEYINHRVAALLNKLHIGQFTKSRARQCNDNALDEGKNAAVIRTYLGYDHIPQRFADKVNAFTQGVLSPYLNHHRPCLFATEHRDDTGRLRRHYRDRDIATPYEKLKSLPEAARWLKPGVTFESLDAVAYAHSDLDAALAVNAARNELFRALGREWGYAA